MYRVIGKELQDQKTGIVRDAPFEHEGLLYWLTEEEAAGGWALREDGEVFKLGPSKRTGLLGARAPNSKETRPEKIPTCVCVTDEDAEQQFFTFENQTYSASVHARRHLVARIVGSDELSVFLALHISHDGSIRVSGKLNPEEVKNYGAATPVANKNSSIVVSQPQPVAGNLAMFLPKDPTPSGPVINEPLQFWAPETVNLKTGNTLNPIRGIPLMGFRVPEWFGKKDKKNPKVRRAIFVLTTAPTIVNTRDEKYVQVPAGSFVWVEIKHDIKRIYDKTLIAPNGQRAAMAFEFAVMPLGKASFPVIVEDKEETHSAWRMKVTLERVFRSEVELQNLESFMLRCPGVPTQDDIDDETIAAASSDID